MPKLTPFKNGAGNRKCQSWIGSFISYTDNLESAPIFRKWTAITAIAAALEQKTWLMTSSALYPNLYTILVGYPGVGKTRTIMAARQFLAELPEFHIAPISLTMASLVDFLCSAKRTIINLPYPAVEFHACTLITDDWSAFMSAYDKDLIAGLTQFYDVWPYEHWRRGKEIRLKIPRPQLNLIAGTTPSDLIDFMPVSAWGQGFTSRVILVYSDERFVGDDFKHKRRDLPEGMIHDLKVIYSLQGEFQTTEGYRQAIADWRRGEENPKPSHPKLAHYNTRRRAHLYKLSMVSAVDRGNELVLTDQDYQIALGWLAEAELNMPGIFEAGSSTVDARAIDEIVDFIRRQGKPVPHHRVIRETAQRVPAHAVLKVVDIMWLSGRIKKDTEANTYLVRDE